MAGPEPQPISRFNGSTGPVPSRWWTFRDDDEARAIDALVYMEELALPEHEIAQAQADGLAVELIIPLLRQRRPG